MSGVTDYKILEILELEPVSNRLRNAVNRAYQKGMMPCDTVMEYSQSKEKIINDLYRLPSVGEKTVNELVSLLEKYHQRQPQKKALFSTHISIPDTLKAVSIESFINSRNCSVRLQNALTRAIDRHEFRVETLGELNGMSVNALQIELRRVKNLGSKSVDEFVDLLRSLSSHNDQSLSEKASLKEREYLHYNNVDWTANYQTLLNKWQYSDTTVAEIIRKSPGLLSRKDKVLNKLEKEYSNTTLSEVLTSSGSNLNEIAEKLVKDKNLSKYLASLLLDFHDYLSSKNNFNFSYEEYFSVDISMLNEKESDILLSRFGAYKRTLDELGRELGVTRERVRQIEAKALAAYIKVNRVGLFHLAEDLEKKVKESKGVLSVNVIQNLYGVSRQKVELILNIIIPDNNDTYISRNGEYVINGEFKGRQDTVFGQIKKYLYRHGGSERKKILNEIVGINRQILDYFLFVYQNNFSENADGEIEIIVTAASERARIVLAAAGQPLHTSEAGRLYRSIFKEDITEHALGATLGRLRDVLIVGPGTYALYSHLSLTSKEIDVIRGYAYSFIQEKNRYLSSRVIFEHLYRIRPDFRLKEPHFNYYLVYGILQDDDRFLSRRGFMVGLHDFGDYVSLETEVAELVETHGPISIPELMKLLRPTRGELTNGSVRNSLLACDEIFLTAEKRKWDVADRVFREINDVRKLQIAIRMSAYRESIALSSVYNRVRSTGIDYALGTILSVVWKDPGITLEGDYVRYVGEDAEIESYFSTGQPKTLWQLDYRNYTEEKLVDTSTLDALVKEFDLYV